jgi:hypothetical protein
VRQAGHKPSRHRISTGRHHDRDRLRRLLSRADRGAAPRNNHLDLEPDQVSREVAETFVAPLRIPLLDDQVLAFDVTEVAQPLSEGL